MIHTETTPNPDSLKFLSEKTISTTGTEEFQKEQKHKVTIPFVKELLNFTYHIFGFGSLGEN